MSETTKITEEIKNDLGHKSWRIKQQETIRRNKLEEYIECIYLATKHLDELMHNRFFYENNTLANDKAASKSDMLQLMYFPELKEEHHLYKMLYMNINIITIEGKQWIINQTKNNNSPIIICEDYKNKYLKEHKKLLESIGSIEKKVEELSKKINFSEN